MDQPMGQDQRAEVAAAAAGADSSGAYVKAPYNGVVDNCWAICNTAITGANTDSRTIQLFNRGQDGTGTTKVAEKAFTAGVNAAADDDTAIPVITTGTPPANQVAKGDILEFVSLHVGATGLAGPAFTGVTHFSRVGGA